jgi:hypothetical protein
MDYLSDANRRKVLIVLPEPVDDRLESLTRVARAARIQVSRSQLLAALVASAPTDPARLARVMHHYLAQDVQVFSQEHPGTDLPQILHPGAKRGRANRRNRERAGPEATDSESSSPQVSPLRDTTHPGSF